MSRSPIPAGHNRCWTGWTSRSRRERPIAIVGVNGAGKTTLVKLICRLYDPDGGDIEVDGIDFRDLAVASWRSRLAVVFQDFARFDLSVRANVAPLGAPDDLIWASLAEAGATAITSLDTVLAKGYDDGTDLSGGQWQRIAIARALCAIKQGAELRDPRRTNGPARRSWRTRDLRPHARGTRGTRRPS